MTRVTLMFLTLWLAGCATLSRPVPVDEAARLSSDRFRLAIAYQRAATFEPCGCSLNPKGGMDNELRLLQAWEREGRPASLVLSAGSTFVPEGEAITEASLDVYRRKARFLVRGLDLLHTSAVGLTVEDGALGLSSLRELAQGASFPLVATNLYDEHGMAPFPTAIEIPAHPRPFLIVSLSGPPRPDFSGVSALEAGDPIEALRRVFAEYAPDGHVVIVLSTLSPAAQRRIRAVYPELRIWVGKDAANAAEPVRQVARDALVFCPLERGQSVTRADFTLRAGASDWYNPLAAEFFRARSDSDPSVREIASVSPDRASQYDYETTTLRADEGGEPNAISTLIENYLDTVAQAARSEAKAPY